MDSDLDALSELARAFFEKECVVHMGPLHSVPVVEMAGLAPDRAERLLAVGSIS